MSNKRKQLLRRGLLLLAVLLLFLALYLRNHGDPGNADVVRLEGWTMGTAWHVQLSVLPLQTGRDALEQMIQAELDGLDHEIFSTWDADSELSRFNQAEAPVRQAVSADMLAVTRLAKSVHDLSAGAFDPSVGPLVDLWGFGPTFSSGEIPSEEDIQAARAALGFERVEIDEAAGMLVKQADVSLDYSAIAKGYAVDQVAALLEARGVENYLVEVGGELLVRGEKMPGQEWRIGIETPETGPRSVFQAIGNAGRKLAVAASGDYRNYFEFEGQRYSHEIDPRSGWPVSHDLVSVTVLHDRAATADALATALMVMGPGRALDFAAGRDLPVYLIMRGDSGYESQYSEAFSDYLRATETERRRESE